MTVTPEGFVPVEIGFSGSVSRAASGAPVPCEDACALIALPEGRVRAAIADGASDSLHADVWAQILVQAALADFPSADDWFVGTPLPRARQAWRERTAAGTSLPWYVTEVKQARGAYAALLTVEVTPEGRWQAVAVGDCVLVLQRGASIVVGFPFRRAAEFPPLPVLVGTNDESLPSSAVRRHEGRVQPGDDLYLMTDALAAWFLGEAERGREPERWLRDLPDRQNPRAAFAERVHELRALGRLRNDDTTLIHLRFPAPAAPALEPEVVG